jgi:phosphate transport system protein
MAQTATEMLRSALDAFTNEDSELSRQIIERDKFIDESYRRVFGELLELMVDNPAATTGAAHLLFVAKHLERIGDYVKDICELNVYPPRGGLHQAQLPGKAPERASQLVQNRQGLPASAIVNSL